MQARVMVRFAVATTVAFGGGAMGAADPDAARDGLVAEVADDGAVAGGVAGDLEAKRPNVMVGTVRIGGEDVDVPMTSGLRALIEQRQQEAHEYLLLQKLLEPERDALLDRVESDSRKEALRNEPQPWEVRAARQRQAARAKASNLPLKPVVQSLRRVRHDPDLADSVAVKVLAGYAVAISFLDLDGLPWAVRNVVVGDGDAFGVERLSDGVLAVEILKDFSESNALVELEGLGKVLVLRLVGSEKEVDARLEIQLPRVGPGSQVAVVPGAQTAAEGAGALLYQVLDRPHSVDGSRVFSLRGEGRAAGRVAAQSVAVHADGRLLLRTRAALVSPAPVRSLGSPSGGTVVHEIPEVGRLLFAEGGELVALSLAPLSLPVVDVELKPALPEEG